MKNHAFVLSPEEARSAEIVISHQYLPGAHTIKGFQKFEVNPMPENPVLLMFRALFRGLGSAEGGDPGATRGRLHAEVLEGEYQVRFGESHRYRKARSNAQAELTLLFSRDGRRTEMHFEGSLDVDLSRNGQIRGKIQWEPIQREPEQKG